MNWMTDLSDSKKKSPITQLAIPGSHDSGAYYLDANGPLVPGEPAIFGVAKQVVCNWSVTQDLDFDQQLNIGVRYFDIRVSPYPETRELRIVHALYGHPVKQGLERINAFLDVHPTEVVILDFHQLIDFTEQDNNAMVSLISECFGNKLAFRQETLDNTTLSSLLSQGKQIIALYAEDTSAQFLWPHSWINSPWADVQNTPDLIAFLDENLPLRDSKIFYVSQGVISPDTKTITTNLLSSLKAWDAENAVSENLEKWVKEPSIGPQLNVVHADFVDNLFVQTVIERNI